MNVERCRKMVERMRMADQVRSDDSPYDKLEYYARAEWRRRVSTDEVPDLTWVARWACIMFASDVSQKSTDDAEAVRLARELLDLDDAQGIALLSGRPLGADDDPFDPSPRQVATVVENMVDTGVVDWGVAARLMT